MADTLALSPNVPRAAVNTGAKLWVSSFLVAGRMVRKFVRTPQLIAFTAIQSALFLLMFRFAFGGAIGTGGSLSYVNFLVPGFIATTVLWSGMGAATGVAEDVEHGFIDRLRSLPIPRAAVLIGRSLADTALLVWGLAIAVVFGFAVGFRLHGSVSGALAALGLCVVFGFAFEWIFIVIGLVSGTAQAAQQMGLVITPLVFLSSAYVPVASMPDGVRQFSEFQPVTPMVDAVRRLTTGPQGQALLPHSIGHYVGLSLVEAAASQINGCARCTDMHTKDAEHAGETSVRLNMVAVWREATVFTEAERAALELTEQGTRIADAAGGVTDQAWANAAKHYDDEQLAALVSLIAVINAYNRLSVTLQAPGGDYQPGQWG